MKRKLLLVLLMVILIPLVLTATYRLIKFMDDKSALSSLEKYEFVKDEKIIKSYQYEDKKYVVSRYYDNSSSWSHLHLLLKDKKDYYVLENIRKCDIVDDGRNLYLKDNELYIHCIGKKGIIDKYLINDLNVEKETFTFNFKDTPNISQPHMGIDNVDQEFIYLSSPFKIDTTIEDEPKVKCSFKNKKCNYMNRNKKVVEK